MARYARKDLEVLHKQIPFVPFLVCSRSNHLLIATPYRPILSLPDGGGLLDQKDLAVNYPAH
jgi:hypothetical protein